MKTRKSGLDHGLAGSSSVLLAVQDRKTFALIIGKHVKYMTRLDALLMALPERRIQQIGVVLHEHLANRIIAQQEGLEGFRKNIPGPDRIPDLAAHFFFFVVRRRQDRKS